MKRSKGILGMLAAAGLTGAAVAGLPSSTVIGFEAPDYVLGPISGQHNWVVAEPWVNVNGAVVTDQLAASGTQSVKFDGSILIDSCNIQMPVSFAPTVSTDAAYLEWDMLLTTPGGYPATDLWAIEAHGFDGAPLAWAGLSGGTGEVLLYAMGAAPIHTGVLIPFNTWARMRLTIDLGRNWTTLAIDGNQIAQHPMPPKAGASIDMIQVRIETPSADSMFLDNLNLVPLCKADFNGDGTASVQDIFTFLQMWFGGSNVADINHDGSVSPQDIFTFLAAWFAGCG